MLLAVVATKQECRALLSSLEAAPVELGPYQALQTRAAAVIISGIGPAASAAATATALALMPFDAVLSLGICGGFTGAADIGDVIVATDIVAADLGADSPDGFLAMGQLGWDHDSHPVDPGLLATVVGRLGEVVAGRVLTVSTVTGTDARAGHLAERHGPVAEAMEGWGVLTATLPHGLPMLEVRTVSNVVGVRDLSTWDLPAAFTALTHVGARLLGDSWL